MNVLASSLVLVALMATVYAGCGPCPEGYLYRANACYKFYDVPKTWAVAEQRCVEDGGHLASVHSDAENDVLHQLSQFCPDDKDGAWIGLQDDQVENSFSWTDGSPADYFNWHTDEPNDAGSGEDCTELYFVEGTWNDHFCTAREHRFICKIVPGP